MFERYTEKARRVVFFARYEASQYGSPYIETEHILLGILREDKAITALVLPDGALESVRKRIEHQTLKGPKNAVSVDLPLSNESKRVLAYAAEEAERLGHKHIGSEHLLLGLLRERKSFGALLLHDHGVELAKTRQILREIKPEGSPSGKTVTIHGAAWDADYIEEAAKDCRSFFWQKQDFSASDVAIHREDRRISFNPQLSEDSEQFELVKGGWKKETCKICHWELQESDDPELAVGYTNGRDWLCCECYERFVAPNAEGRDQSLEA
jgi:ATP-dependent Clp protease ATP-binding subunit ClpA